MFDSETIFICRRLVRDYVHPYVKQLIIAMIAMLIVAAATALNAWLLKPALDYIFGAKQQDMLLIIPLIIVSVGFIKGAAVYVQSVLMRYIGQRIVTDIQMDFYAYLLHADLELLQRYNSGRLLSRFTYDINVIRNSLLGLLTTLIREFLTVVFLIGVMIYQNWTLSIIALLVFPIAVLPLMRLGKRMRKLSYQTQEQLGDYTAQLDETLQGIRIVKAYNNELFEIQRARQQVERICALYLKSAKVGAATSPLLETLSAIAIAGVIAYGGYQVLQGVTTAGAFFSFIAALIMAYKPLKSLSDINTSLQEGVAAAKRLIDVLDIPTRVADPLEPKIPVPVHADDFFIELKNVNFAYPGHDMLAISGLSAQLRSGKMIAIVGGSGSGKSTLLNLLMRFYDVTNGAIQLGGVDIRQMSLRQLRQHIAFVGQETVLFDDTVAANIRYGNVDASMEEVRRAAQLAGADEFIMSLPDRYDTMVGQHGFRLSGGQRQRLSLARAFLKDSPIIILDEATSALDSVSERHVQSSLDRLRQQKIMIVVAHRLSTIISADMIFVMRSGHLIETGTHQSLLEQNGEYANLYHRFMTQDESLPPSMPLTNEEV
jgi:subfamily B ATP-binding cassette protein MsbA